MKNLHLCALYALFAVLCLCLGGGSSLLTAQDGKKLDNGKKEYVSPMLPGGVPVFQPGKTDPKKVEPKKTDEKEALPMPPTKDVGPPAAVVEEGGKMPLKFIKNKLSDMKEGEKGYIPISAIMVDSDRGCWVDINSTVFSPTPLRKDIVVQISRDEKGYNLGLTEKLVQHQWTAVDNEQTKGMTNIKSVRVLPDE